MSLLLWNCRGLGRPAAIRNLKALFLKFRPSIIFLSETISSVSRMNYIRTSLEFNSGVHVPCIGRSGGLSLMWNEDATVDLLSYSQGHIDVKIKYGEQPAWRFTGFYGNPKHELRQISWTLLRRLAEVSTLPWLCGGDFNEILHPSEKEGMAARPRYLIENFRQAVLDCNLIDLGFQGPKYTWTNGRPEGPVRERLDRCLADNQWIHRFSQHQVYHLSNSRGDHLPLLITDKQPPLTKRKWHKLPRFEPFWLQEDECSQIFKDRWEHVKLNDWPAVPKLMCTTRSQLAVWAKEKFGNIRTRIAALDSELLQVRSSSIYDALKEKSLLKQLEQLQVIEEDYWRQRSRVQWLEKGDRNTSFFHHKASSRKARNEIKTINDPSGNLITSEEGIKQVAKEFFSSIFQTSAPTLTMMDELPFTKLTSQQILRLSMPFSEAEVNKALKQLAPRKSPGPDGLHAIFLQDQWKVMGPEVMKLCLQFLNNGGDLSAINTTYLTLIPKVQQPQTMSDFRPISLCNNIYKLLSRTIVNRLKIVMPSVIDHSQSAFVQGRLITDNVILAYEAHHSMSIGAIGCSNHMALKLDMSKAFDRVEWPCLEKMMQLMEFPASLIKLIMQCLHSVSLAVLVNGSPSENFQPSRGIRQGDPLSPFLFILCAEGFSALLKKASAEGTLKGIQFGRTGPELNHLLFADDSLVLAEATPESVVVIKTLLKNYERLSGQVINFQKSMVTFSKSVTETKAKVICEGLGIQRQEGAWKYLGMPMCMGRNRKEAFNVLKDRVWKKLSNWKSKFLSMAGKETLIKSVIQAIPTYFMQCFQLPTNLCNSILQLVRNFWWRQSNDSNGINWKAWKHLCQAKDQGGLGFRDLSSFNQALLGKQCWRILQFPGSLVSQVLKAKYFKNSEFLNACPGSRPSYLWRSLLHGRKLVEKGLRWRIGNGENISLWDTKWIPLDMNFKAAGYSKHMLPDGVVADLLIQDNYTWCEPLVRDLFLPYEADAILAIPVGISRALDRLIWHYHRKGTYTVKSGYWLAQKINSPQSDVASSSAGQEQLFWRNLWSLQVIPKVKNFIWKMAHNILPTTSNLRKKHCHDGRCALCHNPLENDRHCFFECIFAKKVWASFALGRKWSKRLCTSIKHLLADIMNEEDSFNAGLIIMIMWGIWKARATLSSRDPLCLLLKS